MNSEGIRLPPKPACQPPSALLKSTQLDLTPEKQTSQTTARSKLNTQTRASVPIQKGLQERNEMFSSLAQPSINSTKRVSEKLMALQNEQFNAADAIAKELENSVTARANLGEQVAQAVNVKKGTNLYFDLVSIDVDTEEILAECAPRKARSAARTNKPLVQEPDIMAFFSEDFESEMASFDFDFYREDPSPTLSHAPISHAFDLYHHIQCWQQP